MLVTYTGRYPPPAKVLGRPSCPLSVRCQVVGLRVIYEYAGHCCLTHKRSQRLVAIMSYIKYLMRFSKYHSCQKPNLNHRVWNQVIYKFLTLLHRIRAFISRTRTKASYCLLLYLKKWNQKDKKPPTGW